MKRHFDGNDHTITAPRLLSEVKHRQGPVEYYDWGDHVGIRHSFCFAIFVIISLVISYYWRSYPLTPTSTLWVLSCSCGTAAVWKRPSTLGCSWRQPTRTIASTFRAETTATACIVLCCGDPPQGQTWVCHSIIHYIIRYPKPVLQQEEVQVSTF
jgi:hypothetical protein